MLLQLAMDMYDEQLYWDVLEKTHDVIDILELGNIGGLLGSKLIDDTRAKYPDVRILWDAKATHNYPCIGVVQSHPEYISVTSDADDKQMKLIVETAHKAGVKVIGDLYVGYNGPDQVHRIAEMGCDQISFHPNADAKKYPMGDVMVLDYVQAIAPKGLEISTYGGFTKENVFPVLERKPDIIVVGADIWMSDDPRKSCLEWKELLKKYE